MLSELLTSNTRAEVMRILFNGQGEEHYLRDLEKLSHVKINSLQKEVKHLSSLDLLKARKDGNRIYYSANTEHPLYPELVAIVEKTVGIVYELKQRLEGQKIDCAFVFGSYATGSEKGSSDIDLIVIGDISMRGLSKVLSRLQEKISREINPHIFTVDEFKSRVKKKDHFLTSVLSEEIKPIIGNVDEFR